MHVLLASASPRRRQLLTNVGVTCDVLSPDVDERVPDQEDPSSWVLAVAEKKARAVPEEAAHFAALRSQRTPRSGSRVAARWASLKTRPTPDGCSATLRREHLVGTAFCWVDRATGTIAHGETVCSEVHMATWSSEDIDVPRHRRAMGQGGRIRHPRTRGAFVTNVGTTSIVDPRHRVMASAPRRHAPGARFLSLDAVRRGSRRCRSPAVRSPMSRRRCPKDPATAVQTFRRRPPDFGEARTRAWRDKADALPDDIRWHFIGSLQTKKVRELDGRLALIHSVDREKLVQELGRRGLRAPVLLQCNVSGEASKAGATPSEAGALLEAALDSGLDVRGLMTMAPLAGGLDAARSTFEALAQLRDSLASRASLSELSMGMSGDMEEAVASGATLVRVGTAIFGPREAA